MVDVAGLKAANADRWASAKLTRNFVSVAKSLVAAKVIYSDVQRVTKVPWWFIAVVHERESSQDWGTSLAQGDPWNTVSVHEPRGRGPFVSWQAAAIDALVYCHPYAAKNLDWSTGGTLTLLEEYNGLGYASRGKPSPYLWAGTDQYKSGKILVDHGPIEYVYPSGPRKGQPVIDPQMGCAGLLLTMMQLDNSIQIGTTVTSIPAQGGIVRVAPIVAASPVVQPKPAPLPAIPKDTLASWVKSWFA